MASKTERWVEETLEKVQEGDLSINEAIEAFDERMRPYEFLKTGRDRLLSARRALLGVGSRTTSSGGSRLTQDEVAKAMGESEGGITVAELSQKTGANDGQVRGHLNRGRGERFLQKDGKWFLRDPENGINTEEDLD